MTTIQVVLLIATHGLAFVCGAAWCGMFRYSKNEEEEV